MFPHVNNRSGKTRQRALRAHYLGMRRVLNHLVPFQPPRPECRRWRAARRASPAASSPRPGRRRPTSSSGSTTSPSLPSTREYENIQSTLQSKPGLEETIVHQVSEYISALNVDDPFMTEPFIDLLTCSTWLETQIQGGLRLMTLTPFLISYNNMDDSPSPSHYKDPQSDLALRSKYSTNPPRSILSIANIQAKVWPTTWQPRLM